MGEKPLSRVASGLVVVGLVVGLAGCTSPKSGSSSAEAEQASRPSPGAPAKSAINASDYLTKADASAVLGKPVSDANLNGDGVTYSSVNYMAPDMSGIGLLVRTYGDPATALAVFNDAQGQSKAASTVDPVAVQGLGDKAYWAGGNLNQMNVLKGNRWLIVSVFFGHDKSFDLGRSGAGKVLGRVR